MIKWLVILFIALGAFLFYRGVEAPVSELVGEIVVESLKEGDLVSSPLTVSGRARGPWYFEASAPFSVLDANGNILAQSYVTAEGEWMTEEFVPFSGSITFIPTTETGEVVFKNDNPSGDPERDKYLRIKVRFAN